MIVGITYTDDNMTISANKCAASMEKNGCNYAEVWKLSDISDDFRNANKEIFYNERGAGCYWLFKPYIIYKSMLALNDGDMLIYSDAGVEFITPVNEIISRMDEDFFFFTNTHPQFHWTKLEVMIEMGMANPTICGGQAQASVIFIRVNQKTKDFIKQWLLWCQMPDLINDVKILPQLKEFQDHRHDQSILTNLIYKHGYKMHWWPTAYAEHIRVEGDDYPVMFNHHRRRNNEW